MRTAPHQKTPGQSLAASLFNAFASIVLVAISSGVMVWFLRTEPNVAVGFAPVYLIVLIIIGGFFFSGRGGKWAAVHVILQALGIFVVLPLLILLYVTVWANTALEVQPNRSGDFATFRTNHNHTAEPR